MGDDEGEGFLLAVACARHLDEVRDGLQEIVPTCMNMETGTPCGAVTSRLLVGTGADGRGLTASACERHVPEPQ